MDTPAGCAGIVVNIEGSKMCAGERLAAVTVHCCTDIVSLGSKKERDSGLSSLPSL